MSAFFSGTDNENLHDRSLSSNYFAMLVVNFNGNYVAKLAFKAKKKNESRKTILSFANNSDGLGNFELSEGSSEEEVLVVMDMNIIHEVPPAIEVDEFFSKRFEEIKKIKEEEKKPYVSSNIGYQRSFGGFGKQQSFEHFDSRSVNDWDNDDDWGYGNKFYDNVKNKKINDMTDKEFNNFERNTMYNSPKKFELRDAKRLINSVLNNDTSLDYTDPIERLKNITRNFGYGRKKISKKDWVDNFENQLSLNFDKIWPSANKDDYKSILKTIIDYIKPYTHIESAFEIEKIAKEEINLLDVKTY